MPYKKKKVMKVDIKILESALSKALSETENKSAAREYANYVDEYLKENRKVTSEMLSIVIEGVTIDQCMNLFCYLQEYKKEEIKETIDLITKNDVFKENKDGNAFKFLCAIMGFLITTRASVQPLWNVVVNYLPVKSTSNEKKSKYIRNYDMFLKKYFLEFVIKDTLFPEWKITKASIGNIEKFINLLKTFLSTNTVQEDSKCVMAQNHVKRWLSSGNDYIREQKIVREVKEKKPPKKSEELFILADHYKRIEEELEKALFENSKLKMWGGDLEFQISNLERDKLDVCRTLKAREEYISTIEKKLEQVSCQLDESKALTNSLDTFMKDSEQALRADIAKALKNPHIDFIESEFDVMDVELGEIYRESLRSIFKILEGKGIIVG